MKAGSGHWQRMIVDGATAMGIPVKREHAAQFALHAGEMKLWNRKINLTAITDAESVAVKHFLDSIALCPLMPGGGRVLDVGSGAGFPGIPLKVMQPELSVTLIDGVRKKVHFQRQVIRRLGLTGISAHHLRIETAGRGKNAMAPFDIIVSRAVTAPDKFAAMAQPLLKKRGRIIAMYSGLYGEEDGVAPKKRARNLTAPRRLAVTQVKPYTLPYLGLERSLIVLERVNPDAG